MRRDQTAPYLAALATLLAAGTLLPVVSGSHWAWEALLLVSLVTATGMGLRSVTRSPGLVVLGQSAVGVLGITLVFVHSHAVLGFLPGPDALGAMGRLAQSGMDATRQFSTPAPPVPGINFLLVLGVVAAAIAVDALAVTFGSAVAAGLPLLVLYCVPAAVLPKGASAVSFAMVAGGWLILLGHDGRLRVNEWGRVLRKGPDSGKRRFGDDDLEVVGASARRLGVVTVVAAIVVPMLLPSLANGLIDPSHTGGAGGANGGLGATSIDPILTLKQNLTARSTASVLTYTTTQAVPPPLRMVTDDQFNGETWRTSDGQPRRDQGLSGTLPAPVGLSSVISATQQQMHVKVGTLSEGYLPVPYPATKVTVDGTWDYAQDSLDIVGRGTTTRGLSYTVSYLDVEPTVSQLQTAPLPSEQMVADYTQLPDFLPSSILRTARQVTANATSEYDKAAALQEWFRTGGGFSYDTSVVTRSNVDAVSSFLASKRGYCVQFSSAMAVMARLLGIPARIGVGFLPGGRQSNGSQSVSLNDAHAWPELYFEGVGWVRFEPTPAVRSGAPPSYSQPTLVSPIGNVPSSGATAPNSHDAVNKGLNGVTGSAAAKATAGSGSAGGFTSRVPLKGWVLIVMALIAALATPVAAVLSRRRRRRRARDAVTKAETAWGELLERVDDLGIELPTGATPRQIQQRLIAAASLGPDAREALGRLVHTLEQVRYAPRPSTAEGPDAPVDPSDDVRRVLAAVRATTDRSRRLRARVLPRSGTEVLLGLSARAGERIAGVDRRIARTGRTVAHPPGTRNKQRRRRRIFDGRPH
jgi:transglutaminase-like putative cysteine protease